MEMELDTSTGTYFYDLPYLWNMSRLLKAQGWISSDINWLQLDDPHLYPRMYTIYQAKELSEDGSRTVRKEWKEGLNSF